MEEVIILNKKIEVRITETEKDIINALRDKNVNISEKIRDFILTIDINISRKLLKNEYDQNWKQITEIDSQLIKLKQEYKSLKKENLIQNKIEAKNLIKLKIKELLYEKKQLEKFFEKYSVIFPRNIKLFDNF